MGMAFNRAAFMRKARRFVASFIPFVLAVSTLSAISVPFANAATVTATGTNPSVCNQEVGNSTNVESSRVGNKCVVEFKNIGTTTWQVPTGITSAQVMVVAGGGSGGGLDWTGVFTHLLQQHLRKGLTFL
jgi:hypothetical protein